MPLPTISVRRPSTGPESTGRALRRSAALVAALCAASGWLGACRSASAPGTDPTGAVFPSVVGEALDGTRVRVPEDLGEGPAILLVGYVQDAQFDLDRWLLGLRQAGTPGELLELPTIPGLVPRLLAARIDAGMRSGIPSEDWGTVVTLYGAGAERVRAFTGGSADRNGRVFLLDSEGRVAWYHDRGYAAGPLLALDRTARRLAGRSGGAPPPFAASMDSTATPWIDLDDPASLAAWRPLDDTVMGGGSASRLVAGEDGGGRFEGHLATAGGFASVRTPAPAGAERIAAGWALRVRGDGRVVRMRLATEGAADGLGYQAAFRPPPGAWTELVLPPEAFLPMRRGRLQPDAPVLDPAAVREVGLMVADGPPGPFAIEVAWIDVR